VPPDGWIDEGKLSEFIDGHWVRKPDLGRMNTSLTIQAVLDLLLPFERTLGGTILRGWHMLAVPDLLRPDVVMTFPKYTIYDGYLVAPAFLTVEVRVKEQQVEALVRKCRDKYHPYGTPYCWIVDIEKQQGYQCHRESGRLVATEMLTAGPDVSISMNEILQAVHGELGRTSH
jgi:Uma2 family endonuclease